MNMLSSKMLNNCRCKTCIICSKMQHKVVKVLHVAEDLPLTMTEVLVYATAAAAHALRDLLATCTTAVCSTGAGHHEERCKHRTQWRLTNCTLSKAD